MITVINLNRQSGLESVKRLSNASLNCSSGPTGPSIGPLSMTMTPNYGGPRSPLSPVSPRSPRRLSPSFLVAPDSNQTSQQNMANINKNNPPNAACSSTINETSPPPTERSTPLGRGPSSEQLGEGTLLTPDSLSAGLSNLQSTTGYHEELNQDQEDSLNPSGQQIDEVSGCGVVAIGHCHLADAMPAARNLQGTMEPPIAVGDLDDLDEEAQFEAYCNYRKIHRVINDFCVRHTREELEFLINRAGNLKIIDCYFSDRHKTLCMVVQNILE